MCVISGIKIAVYKSIFLTIRAAWLWYECISAIFLEYVFNRFPCNKLFSRALIDFFKRQPGFVPGVKSSATI